jgi:intron-binding protein aquarius
MIDVQTKTLLDRSILLSTLLSKCSKSCIKVSALVEHALLGEALQRAISSLEIKLKNVFVSETQLHQTFGSSCEYEALQESSDELVLTIACDSNQSLDKVDRIRYSPDCFGQDMLVLTQAQIQAILSCLLPGNLTLVSGACRTGKATIAGIILENLRIQPDSGKTLLISHSEARLEYIFDIARNVSGLEDSRHYFIWNQDSNANQLERCMRDILAVRQRLLGKVFELVKTLPDSLDAETLSSSCEIASTFFACVILPRIKAFLRDVSDASSASEFNLRFPFKDYFDIEFTADSGIENLELAQVLFQRIYRLFEEIAEVRPFEILNQTQDQLEFITNNFSHVLAVSARKLVHLLNSRNFKFRFTNVIFDEAHLIPDADSLLVLLSSSQLQIERLILLGDSAQARLPLYPENLALSSQAINGVSLFNRLRQSNQNVIELNTQFSISGALVDAYRAFYGNLRDNLDDSALAANPGFAFPCQFVSVTPQETLKPRIDRGETWFSQNPSEAEFVSSLALYLCLIG